MPPRFLSLVRPIAAAGFVWAAAAQADAQLAARSPVLPPEGAVAAPAAESALEFYGYIAGAEGIQFRVNDAARKTGAWVKLDERSLELDLVAKKHDGDHDLLMVEYQGRSLTLPLRRSKIVSAGTAPAPMPMQASVPPPMPAAATVMDRQRQLENLAVTTAQRRAAHAVPLGQLPASSPAATRPPSPR